MKHKPIALALTLFLCTTMWAQFEHPDLKSGKIVVKNAIILPPNVRIVKSGVKSTDELLDDSHLMENALPPLIASVLQERRCALNDKALASDVVEKAADLKYPAATIHTQFHDLSPHCQ